MIRLKANNKCNKCGEKLLLKKVISFLGLRNTLMRCPRCKEEYEVKNTKTSFFIGFLLTMFSFIGVSFFYLEENYLLFLIFLSFGGMAIFLWASLSKLETKK